MNNLTLRIITALIGVGVIIGSIFLSAWSFAIVFMVIAVFTHYEYIKTIRNTTDKFPKFELVYSLLVGIYFIFLLNSIHLFDYKIFEVIGEFWLVLIIGFIIAEIFYNRENPFQQIGLNILGIFYIPYAFGSFIQIGVSSFDHQFSVHLWIVLGLLFMVWFNDSFAYFAGRLFGKRKLFERISPKKTWEGFWGGLFMTLVCAGIFSFIFSELNLWQWLVWGVIIVVSATLGDLAESLLKRSTLIKDSGTILPGHGGFLDRFDGFVFAAPFSVAYIEVLAHFNCLPA